MIVKLLGVLLAAYVTLVAVLWGAQERLVLPGPSRPLPDPRDLGFEYGERVTVTAPDGIELSGWYLPPEPGTARPAPGLLWFYGNMETVGVLSPVFRHLKPKGVGLLALDFRGYGENGGVATESAIQADGESAWRFLASRDEIDAARIAVYGRSIGSTVAMHVASTKPVSAVVLDSPMTSARDVAKEHYWFFPSFLVSLQLDNIGRAEHLNAPLLVLHGSRDRIMPPWMGKAVADAAPDGSVVLLVGENHNSTYSDLALYRRTLWRFVSDWPD